MWQRLATLRNEKGIPPLFFKFSSTSEGYELLLTDLINLWSAVLNRKEVLRNAREFKSSIDPSEDDDQYEVFITKLKDALNGAKGTELGVTTIRDNDEGGVDSGHILLATKTSLPSPLQPLYWKFECESCDKDTMAKQIIRPVIETHATQAQSIENLLQRLKEKDHVLGKLMDKVEASAIDLGLIFPGIGIQRGGVKASTSEQVKKRIPGAAAFDEAAWRSEKTKKGADKGLLDAILGNRTKSEEPVDLKVAQKYWRDKVEEKHNYGHPQDFFEGKTSHQYSRHDGDRDPPTSSEGADPASKSSEAQKPSILEDDSTQDSDDFSPPPKVKKATQLAHPTSSPKPKVSKLGIIGGPKTRGSPSPIKSVSKDTPTPELASATDSDSDDLDSVPVSTKPPHSRPRSKSKSLTPISSPPPSKKPSSSQLGTIGGSRTTKQPSPSTPQKPKLGTIGGSRTTNSASPISTPQKPKLGHIGRQSQSQSSKPPSPSPPPPPPETPAVVEETATAAANRKREELKRQQAEAARKAPARKKRKF